jgi:DNA modification methylase
MKSIHPFPARMAPEILDDLLDDCPRGSIVLDPMCGSGTVVRKAVSTGKLAIGLDSDPLAVLMTSVATQSLKSKEVENALKIVLDYALRYGQRLKSVHDCQETSKFTDFWFAPQQRHQLNALAKGILKAELGGVSNRYLNLLRLALSRTIITKDKGASLGADVSHSRPHRVRISNDYDVLKNFEKFVCSIHATVNNSELTSRAKVRLDDVRKLTSIGPSSIDTIITSPPYLNALDYVRGHKLSLIWLGRTIPELRSLRGGNVGSEAALPRDSKTETSWDTVIKNFPNLSNLTTRQQLMTHRYVEDLCRMCRQFKRVLKKNSKLHVVIGNSTLGNVYVPNSDLFEFCSRKYGFDLKDQKEREIPENRRYLPISGAISSLSKRMRKEVIQSFVLTEP